MDLVFGQPGHGNTVHNTHGNIVPFAQDLNFTAGGTLTFDINSNHFDSAPLSRHREACSSMQPTARRTRPATSGTTRSAPRVSPTRARAATIPGLDIESNGGGDLTIMVNNNQLYQWGSNGAGLLLQAGATSGNPVTFNATVTNNTITQPGTFAVANSAQGFQLNNGTNYRRELHDVPQVPGQRLRSVGDRCQAATAASASASTRRCRCPAISAPQDGTSARRPSPATSRA